MCDPVQFICGNAYLKRTWKSEVELKKYFKFATMRSVFLFNLSADQHRTMLTFTSSLTIFKTFLATLHDLLMASTCWTFLISTTDDAGPTWPVLA